MNQISQETARELLVGVVHGIELFIEKSKWGFSVTDKAGNEYAVFSTKKEAKSYIQRAVTKAKKELEGH